MKQRYASLLSVGSVLFLLLSHVGVAYAVQASQDDFGAEAVMESFEGLSARADIPRFTQPGPRGIPMDTAWFQLSTGDPVAFDSGVTMVWRIGLSDTMGAALVGDFSVGPATPSMVPVIPNGTRKPIDESVTAASDLPDGYAYMTVNGVGELGGVEFAFSSDMFRVGACVTSDYPYDDDNPGWVTLVVYDANDVVIESQQIDVVDIAEWGSNFLGVEAEGIRKVRFVGDFLLLDKLMFEPKPEVVPENVPRDISHIGIFATNSVWLLRGAKIHSGDIVVGNGAPEIDILQDVDSELMDCSSPPPYLNSDCQVSIGNWAYLAEGVKICADSIKLKRKASVGNIQCNYLVNQRGEVRGEELEFSCPEVRLPEFPTPNPGDEYIRIKRGQTWNLEPGCYGEIKMQKRSKLIFTGGVYHLENLDVGQCCKVLFQGPTDVVINNRLRPGSWAYIGPDCKAAKEGALGAKDIHIYVNGINGNSAIIADRPRAAVIGMGNCVKACIYAPNGTLWIRLYSKAEGAFFGREVRIGIGTQVTLDSGF